MSAKAMGRVWDLDLPHNELLVLLAMADHADHAGQNIYPSIGLIAWKTGYSKRQVQRVIQKLVKDGILVQTGEASAQRPNAYRMNLDAGKIKKPFRGEAINPEDRQNVTPDIMTPVTQLRHGRGDILGERGDIAMSPEPSEGTIINRERGKAPPHAHPAMKILAEQFPNATLDAKQIKSICSTATNEAVWRGVVELFANNNWRPLAGNMLERYQKALVEKAKNGNAPSNRPPADLQTITAADGDKKKVSTAADRARIIEAKRAELSGK